MDQRLDAIDVLILRELQADGRLSVVELAERVGLSPSPCLRRVRSLEERGVIVGYRAVVDPAKIGLDLQFIVSCRTAVKTTAERGRMRQALQQMPEVISFHSVTGDVDGVLRVAVPSIRAYEEFLDQKLWPLPLKDIQSRFVIAERKPVAPYDLQHLQGLGEGGASEQDAEPPAGPAAPPAPRRRR